MANFIDGLDYTLLINALMRLIPLLICITLHELAHGYAANKLGDPTAKMMGRLTLNPIKHIDPVGALMILIVGFGWAKPVPVDMRNFKKPKRDMAITALAGPLTNVILAVVVLIILASVSGLLAGGDSRTANIFFVRFAEGYIPTGVNEFIYQIIARTALLSFVLAIFNLLPIPPLDGSKILFSILPDRTYIKLMRYEKYGMVILLALLFIPTILGLPDYFRMIIFEPASFLFITVSSFLGII